MKYILPYLRPYRRQTALAMVLVAFATVCDLLLPTIMNDILNHGVRQSDLAYILRCSVGVATMCRSRGAAPSARLRCCPGRPLTSARSRGSRR